MKNTMIKILVLSAIFSFASCSVTSGSHSHSSNGKVKRVPPGQAKKMNGDKSAKKYAPGQNK
ncbi:hypothetical protein D0817_17235 [Flavobacterium cupreum]|uniref:Quinol oxidase subunit 4 n=2 Tax=Flavobacterium TaxID=237 RepID=A0A434A4J0_9FLAO|nr:hypothetical protein [Flavobacterium cupreum]RUT69245.1 hypothetical protein D0817_17235 [Flavobacterium cupreum]